MRSGWRVGLLFGIPLFVDLSWFVVLALFSVSWGLQWQQDYPSWGLLAYGAGGLMALSLFGSVLLHELGHSLVAKSQGIQVNSITLFLFGGIAAIDEESKTPGKAFQVAIAGPAVSLGLFGLFSLLAFVLPGGANPPYVLLTSLASLNLTLTLFNLIPGLPLDGGQILKAAVWKATNDRFKGIHWAAQTGKILGWTAVVLGGFSLIGLGATSGLWIAFVGWFMVQNATNYDRVTNLQEVLLKIRASEAMTRDFRVLDANMSLRQFADEYLLNGDRASVYFAASDGRYRGLVQSDNLSQIERSEWESATLHQIVQPLTQTPSVPETASLATVIQCLESLRRITVLSPAGAVAGVIDRGDVIRALSQKANFRTTDALIQQVKEAGSYPTGLNLGAIAQAALDSAPPTPEA
ncbi:MAG TPA: site-2 protease family protein [Thermosynechococcaceae cyanobacterium]